MKLVIDRNTPLGTEAFATLGSVTAVDTHEFTPALVREADALVVRSETRVGRELLEGSRVRFVGTATIGTDHVDTEYLASQGIGFASAPGCNANSVCEYVLATMLELGRRHGFRLRGQTLGIVGVGNIGRRVERMAGALGMRVLLCDPPLARATGEAKYLPLDALMEADIITLHVPLTKSGPDATDHFFDARRIAMLKPGAFLINASRGRVVVNDDLKLALRERRIRGAVLDVWEGEPAIDLALADLLELATAHVAGYSFDGKINAVRMIYRALGDAFNLPLRWNVEESGLPSPPVARIDLPPQAGADDATLRSVVSLGYDILRDDGLVRALPRVAAKEVGAAFQKLRTGYRVRREFPAITVAGASGELAAMLSALGFRQAP